MPRGRPKSITDLEKDDQRYEELKSVESPSLYELGELVGILAGKVGRANVEITFKKSEIELIEEKRNEYSHKLEEATRKLHIKLEGV